MSNCSNCESDRIVSISAKCSDLCSAQMFCGDNSIEHDGYVPNDMGIGGGDYIEFEFCLECGQIQGEWPRSHTDLEEEAEDEEDEDES